MSKQQRSTLTTIVCIILFVVTIFYFTSWGYEWISYLLSKTFDVETEKDIFNMFNGLIAMISSVPVFIGAVLAWRGNALKSKFLKWGVIGFITKNILEIIAGILSLFEMPEVTSGAITDTAQSIAGDIFQMGFWIFVMILFTDNLLRRYILHPFSSPPEEK